jgi:transposase
MAASVVPFELPGCRLDAVSETEDELLVSAHATARSAACPECGRRSRRVHGSYVRLPTDLPISDRAVRLRLTIRRFRCKHA